MTPYEKIMYGYAQQSPYNYPSYSNQVTGGYDPSLYSGFGLLSPSFGNYQYNGGDSLYSNGVGGDGISSGLGMSSGSPTGSALGDLGYSLSNMSNISPVAAAISALAAGLMDSLSSTSVNSVNAISGLDSQSDAATAAGASTAAGADGPAGAGSTGMGSDVGGEGASAGVGIGGGAAADSGATGGGGGGAVGSDGSSSDGASSGSSGDGASSGSSGDGASGGGGDSSSDYMGGFIGMPQYIQGMVTRQNTFGDNPEGPDDAYRKTQLGEYVIKKSAVQRYGRGLLDMINSESIPKTKLRGLL